jgi:hypothetical protein
MVKKVVKKTVTETTDEDGSKKTVVKEHAPRTIRKRKSPAVRKKKMSSREREELLIENFVGLQHAMTNLSIKFEKLSDNMVNLLMVFEEAAKGFIKGGGGAEGDKDMLNKIDSLLNQNKTIARGLVLMESKLRGRSESPVSSAVPGTFGPGAQKMPSRPLPRI